MSGIAINLTDFGVVAIILISGLLALVRGLVTEVFSVAGWVGAALTTLHGFPRARPEARAWIENALLADIVTGATIFLVTLVVLSLISQALARRVRDSRLSALDRSLGFVFGLARGAVLVCLAYLGIVLVTPQDEYPHWLVGARSARLIESGAEMLMTLVPREFRSGTAAAGGAVSAGGGDERAFNSLANPLPKGPAARDDPGYKVEERKGLDRLIQTLPGKPDG